MLKTNEKIRTALKERKMHQWELAERLGVSEPTLTRWMRHELSEEEQDRIVSVIEGGDKT